MSCKPRIHHTLPHIAAIAGLAVSLPAFLSAQSTLYWGGGTTDNPASSVDSSSTAVNGGNWDTTLLNWNTSTSATTGWQAWSDGSMAVFKSNKASGATAIDFTSDITAGGIALQFDSGTFTPTLATLGGGEWIAYDRSSTNNQSYTFNGSGGARTITLTDGARLMTNIISSNPQLIFGSNAILAGDDGLNIVGRVQIGSQSTVSGKATLAGIFPSTGGHGSELRVIAGGSLTGLDTFDLGRSARMTVSKNNTVTDGLSDTASVILRNAELNINGSGGTSASETIGSITIEGSGRLELSTDANVASTLALSGGINRGANGKGILNTYSTSANGGLGTANGFEITGHGFAANQAAIHHGIIQGEFMDVNGASGYGTRFLATDASGNLRAAASTEGDANLANWASAGYSASSNLHITVQTGSSPTPLSFSGAMSDDVTIGTLAVGYTVGGGSQQTMDLGGNTLSVDSLAVGTNVAALLRLNLGTGTTSNRGFLTTASGRDLVLIAEASNWTTTETLSVNAAVTDNTGVSNPGAVNLVLGGTTGVIGLHGNNTHTGKTFVNAYMVNLGATGRLLSTSELNIASGSQFNATSNNDQNMWGSGSIAQVVSGGGLYTADSRTVEIGANGTLAPGSFGAGQTLSFALTTGKLHFVSGSTVALTLGTLSDSIAFTTAGDWLSGTFKLDLTSGAGFENGVTYTVFKNITTAGFTPGSVWLDGTELAGTDYNWAFADNAYSITLIGSTIPEPSTMALLAGLCALGFSGLRRRR